MKKYKFLFKVCVLVNIFSMFFQPIVASACVNIIRTTESICEYEIKPLSEYFKTYDGMLELLEIIENCDDLDKRFSNEDLKRINYWLALAATLGMLSEDPEDIRAMEEDIKELLSEEENDYHEAYLNNDSSYSFSPAIYYGKPIEFSYSGIISHCWKGTVKFTKKHTKEVIIGTGVILAGIVTYVLCSPTESSTSDFPQSYTDTSTPKPQENVQPPLISNIPNPPQDNLSHYSESYKIEEPSKSSDPIWDIPNIIEPSPKNFENRIENTPARVFEEQISTFQKQYGKSDNAFSTETPVYIDEKNIFNNPDKFFQENFFYLQGQQALNAKHYDKAIDSFGKAIETNPNNHNTYLDRAYAHLQNGQFDQSLNDYNKYQENEQKKLLSKGVDFIKDSADIYYKTRISIEKGIARGVVDSGKQLLSIAANAIEHPINTSIAIYKVIIQSTHFKKIVFFILLILISKSILQSQIPRPG